MFPRISLWTELCETIYNHGRHILGVKSHTHATELSLLPQMPYSSPQVWNKSKGKLETVTDTSPLLLWQI